MHDACDASIMLETREFGKINISQLPSAYAQRPWFDTITHDPRYVQLNIERFGSGRVVIGSDYPFVLGVARPLAQLEELNPSAADVENITHRAAEAFLNLQARRLVVAAAAPVPELGAQRTVL